jgi:hypothetical protein
MYINVRARHIVVENDTVTKPSNTDSVHICMCTEQKAHQFTKQVTHSQRSILLFAILSMDRLCSLIVCGPVLTITELEFELWPVIV